MVAYAGDGAECAGILDQPAPLPAFEARPYDAVRLLGRRSNAQIETHSSPEYIYDLVGSWDGLVPAGAVLDGGAKRVASFVEDYRSLGGTSDAGHRVWDMHLGWVQSLGIAAFGLVRPVAVPGTVTHYVSPAAQWERTVEVRDADGQPEGALDAPTRPVAARETIRDHWFGGPIVAQTSPLTDFTDWRAAPYREGDYLWMFQPAFADDAGHIGYPFYLGEFDGKLYVDGELAAGGDDPLWMQYLRRARSPSVRARVRDPSRERVLAALEGSRDPLAFHLGAAGGGPRDAAADQRRLRPVALEPEHRAARAVLLRRPFPARARCDAEPDHERHRGSLLERRRHLVTCSQPAASAPRAPSRSATRARAPPPCG